jgi:hypothetical protein
MSDIFPEQPITSLPAAVAFMGALPMPVGPVPRTLDTVEDELTGVSLSLYEEELTTERLRWALASAKRGRARLRAQVAELEHTVQGMAEGLNGHDCPPPGESPMEAVTRFAVRLMEADRLAAELEALELGDLDGRVSATCAEPSHPTWLRSTTDGRGCPWCRIAELEAERHTTNEALDDAVQELRARQSCPCPPADQPGPHQVDCFFDGVPVSPPSERPVSAPVAALREVPSGETDPGRRAAWRMLSREEPHDSPLHQVHRTPHDLPVPETCRLDAAGLDEVSQHFLGGGA